MIVSAPFPRVPIQTLLQRLARRAKIARVRVTPQLLRHTFALNYLRQNPGNLVQLANLLGHESLDATAIYEQPSGEELAEDGTKRAECIWLTPRHASRPS